MVEHSGVDMSRKGTFVCTTGRSGTVYLERVFSRHATEGVRVLHEKHEPSDVTDHPEGKHLIITGRKMLSELYSEVSDFEGAKFVVLVRDLVPTCLSWTRFLLPDYVDEKVPGWWFDRESIPFNRSWSAFQRFVWHWFVTWCRTKSLLVDSSGDVFCMSFDELNAVGNMNCLLNWVGDMNPCSSESLSECKSQGTSHGTNQSMIDRVGPIDIEGEIVSWVKSLDSHSKFTVLGILDWLKSMGFEDHTASSLIGD